MAVGFGASQQTAARTRSSMAVPSSINRCPGNETCSTPSRNRSSMCYSGLYRLILTLFIDKEAQKICSCNDSLFNKTLMIDDPRAPSPRCCAFSRTPKKNTSPPLNSKENGMMITEDQPKKKMPQWYPPTMMPTRPCKSDIYHCRHLPLPLNPAYEQKKPPSKRSKICAKKRA